MCKTRVFSLLSKKDFFRVSKKEFLVSGPKTTIAAPIVRLRTVSSTAFVLGSEQHVFTESGLTQAHSLREKAVREDIARRLGKVCSHFSEDDFERLIAVMAARQVKCERRPTW